MKSNSSDILAKIKKNIKIIESIPLEKYRRILLITTIDSFAQIDNKTKSCNAAHFSSFIEKYAINHSEILKKICPTTFYYDNYNILSEITVLRLDNSRIYCADDEELEQEATRLIDCISRKTNRTPKIKKHSYSWLIYASRSKLVHEMVSVGMGAIFCDENINLPHVAQEIDRSGKISWMLHIPEDYIKEILEEAISNYLLECDQLGKLPFNNNPILRYSWYD